MRKKWSANLLFDNDISVFKRRSKYDVLGLAVLVSFVQSTCMIMRQVRHILCLGRHDVAYLYKKNIKFAQ